MSGGRPTDLTPELSKRLCELIVGGLPVCKAAEHEGIHRVTVYKWAKRNEEFGNALKRARAEAQRQSIAVIRSGAQGWQGEAWYLERSDPKNWGRRSEMTIKPKPAQEAIKPDDAAATVRAKLQAALAELDAKERGATH